MTSHLTEIARETPDKPAYIMFPSDELVTYGELEARSNRVAHLMRSLGLKPRDHIAILMENNARVLEVAWAAQRSGLIFTMIATHLTADEAAYIANDCEATLIFTSSRQAETAIAMKELLGSDVQFISVTEPVEGFASLDELVADMPDTPIPDESEGADMLYSSGTTGRPKGIVIPDAGVNLGRPDNLVAFFRDLWFLSPDTVYLSPGPMYHSAPLRGSMVAQRIGGTVIVMEKFDALGALQAIDRHHVTHSMWVPTMFIRMLRLDPSEYADLDLSSHKVAMHAAAPCPRWVKEQIMEWWGPILYEHYSSTEGCGFTHIGPEEWLEHPGSVGRPHPPTMSLHILDDDGNELAPGEDGYIYFKNGGKVVYHNDPEKTDAVYNDDGWATVGDIGHVDEDGYLYLTDRKAFTIISGGVNIYPQEVENVLLRHPEVVDVAVFGVPHPDMGEEVKAVVQPKSMESVADGLGDELYEYCRANISHYKCPRSIDFDPALPRQENGKLYKQRIRERYLTPETPGAR